MRLTSLENKLARAMGLPGDDCRCEVCNDLRREDRTSYVPNFLIVKPPQTVTSDRNVMTMATALHYAPGKGDESDKRKATPIFSGVMRYFPDALAAVARVSKAGNDKHNPGQALHWARGKSADHGDCIARHQITFDQVDPETGEYHAAAVAWRALAQLQLLEEARNQQVAA